MTPRSTIISAMSLPNVKAWMHVVRHRESGHGEDAYYMISGGGSIPSLQSYPWPDESTTKGWKAVGAGQFIPHTWYGLARAYPDDCNTFSPYAQDFGIVALTAGRGALQDVINGDIATACRKCHDEWTSLPGGSENKRYTIEEALRVFAQYGGGVATQPAAPIEDRSVPAQPTEETMPFLAALLPMVLQLFAPRVQAQLTKVSGNEAGATQLVTELINQGGKLLNIATDPVPTNDQAVQIVAELQKAKDTNAALIQQLEDHALDYLDKLAPTFERLQKIEESERMAYATSQQAAFERNRADPTQNLQRPIMTFTMGVVGVVTVFTGALLAWQMYLKNGEEPNGQLIILFVMLVTTFVNMLRTQNDWGFGSSQGSAAKDAIIARLPKPKE